MSNELQIFKYDTSEVRTTTKDNDLWFVLKDVCDILSLGNPSYVSKRLDEDEKGIVLIDTHGGKQEVVAVNEAGLYNVIIRSDKPEAKKFKRWITHDVLPSIRKSGIYVDTSRLSLTTQASNHIVSLLSTQEIRQNEMQEELDNHEEQLNSQKGRLDATEEKINVVKDTLLRRDPNWRRAINKMFNRIIRASKTSDHQIIRHETYQLLEERAGCNLNTRYRHMRERLFNRGLTKAASINSAKWTSSKPTSGYAKSMAALSGNFP